MCRKSKQSTKKKTEKKNFLHIEARLTSTATRVFLREYIKYSTCIKKPIALDSYKGLNAGCLYWARFRW